MLKSLGVVTGDRVTIYMGRIPEIIVAMLACAKLGAIHSVVFGGFSVPALAGLGVAAAVKGPVSGGPVRIGFIGVGGEGRVLLGEVDPQPDCAGLLLP